ncbi:MAG: hypothetical protein E6K05_01045 [Methanobacteriota archaeon]|nr:MAG: hypothetical protein E6K05_01045 [Euryarchaeota archaeon]
MPSKRPIGVAIIAVLSFLAGLVEVLGGAALLGLAAIGATVGAGFLAAFAGIIGVVLLLVGLVTLAVAIGLWRMRTWAWWIAIIVNIISVVISLGTLNYVGLVFPLIILIYLFVIRDKFGIGGRPAGM